MRKNESITHIMTADVKSVQKGQGISDVYNIMRTHGVHHVPIVDGKKLVGIVSFTDMMKLDLVMGGLDEQASNTLMDQQFSIADVMSDQIVSLRKKRTIRDAVEILGEGKFHSLPVVNKSGDLKGMVTTTDLIRYLGEQY